MSISHRPTIPEVADNYRKVLGFGREKLVGAITEFRGKENIMYADLEGKEFFAKYCTGENCRTSTIAGLINEKEILEKLTQTGVTPQVGELKLYPNGQHPNRARLIIERLRAIPLNHEDMRRGSNFSSTSANEFLIQCAKSYNSIHGMNVLQVDINPGNIMIQLDEPTGEIRVKLVDFELGIDLDRAGDEERSQVLNFYAFCAPMDGALKYLGRSGLKTETLMKAEIHLWATEMFLWLFRPRDDSKHQREMPINQLGECEMPTDWLEKWLEKAGYQIDAGMIVFLQRALSPDLEDRPASFGELFHE